MYSTKIFRLIVILFSAVIIIFSSDTLGFVSEAKEPILKTQYSDSFHAEYAATSSFEKSISSETPYLMISHDSGIYDGNTLTVDIKTPDGYSVAYTTNGCKPGKKDDSGQASLTVTLSAGEGGYLVAHGDLTTFPEFNAAILESSDLPQGRVLCAAVMDSSGQIITEKTRIYFFGKNYYERFPNCIIISIYTDPENLLDYNRGILAKGAAYDAWEQTEETKKVHEEQKNWEYVSNATQTGKEWERPCFLQIYDGADTPTVEQNCGIRVRGAYSRRVSQKSFNIYFRKEYGSNRLSYELFEGIPQYKSFSLNAGGNNTEKLKFKEAFLESMASDLDLFTLSSRSAILFINGEYWGPYLLTEKFSGQLFQDHFGIDKDDVVVIKDASVEVGEDEDIALYEELASFAEKDMSDPEIYKLFSEIMNIRSMADYCALRIYIGDADWYSGKNDVLWRSRDDSYQNGKWQYIPYDIEQSSGTYGLDITSYSTDHFARALEHYPLFAAAWRNEEFRDAFMDSLKKVSNKFDSERVEEELSRWNLEWKPLMKDFYKRYAVEPKSWDTGILQISSFFRHRSDYIFHYVEKWYTADYNNP